MAGISLCCQCMSISARNLQPCQREGMSVPLFPPYGNDRECAISGLREAVELPYTLWFPVCAASPCLFQRDLKAPTQISQTQAPETRSFKLQMRPHALSIDGIEALTARSKQYFAIFKILWVQYCNDLLANQTAEHYTFLSLADITDQMPGQVEDIDTVRRYIKHLQANMSQLLKNAHGSCVEREAIIQSAPLKKFGKKKHGYRLNPYTLHIVPC